MNVVFSSTKFARRPLLGLTLWALCSPAVLLLAVGLQAAETGQTQLDHAGQTRQAGQADQADQTWLPIPSDPVSVGASAIQPVSVVPPAVPQVATVQPPNDLVVRAHVLKQEHRWADVVSICETAARKGTLDKELTECYDLAKIHCDIARRYSENAFRAQLAKLTESDARRVYAEVLARIGSHHVESPNFARLVSRGIRAMDVAVEDTAFVSLYAGQATPERRTLYRQQISQLTAGRSVSSQNDAETLAAWVARIAHTSLGVPPAVSLMEMTAAAMGGLDEYSAFLTNGQLDDLYAQIEGNFVGLGFELKSAADGLLVVHVIPGSPAQRAGIRANDH